MLWKDVPWKVPEVLFHGIQGGEVIFYLFYLLTALPKILTMNSSKSSVSIEEYIAWIIIFSLGKVILVISCTLRYGGVKKVEKAWI